MAGGAGAGAAPAEKADALALEQADLDDVLARVAKVRALRSAPTHAVVEAIAQELHELVDAPCLVTKPVRHGKGFALDFAATRGIRAEGFEAWARILRRTPQGVFLFDPARPPRWQRNILHELALDDPRSPQAAMSALRLMGVATSTHVRVLVCDGPLLLAWVGAWFDRDRPVTNRDRARIRRFARGMKPVLRTAAGMSNELAAEVLETSMAAYPGEAYLVAADGRIACANALGIRALEARGVEAQEELARAVVSAEDSPFEVRVIRRVGLSPLSLVTRMAERHSSLEARLGVAAAQWSLSKRETEVLRELANGRANKDIVAGGTFSLRTVEVHVTALLRKASAASRLELVAKLWRGH